MKSPFIKAITRLAIMFIACISISVAAASDSEPWQGPGSPEGIESTPNKAPNTDSDPQEFDPEHTPTDAEILPASEFSDEQSPSDWVDVPSDSNELNEPVQSAVVDASDDVSSEIEETADGTVEATDLPDESAVEQEMPITSVPPDDTSVEMPEIAVESSADLDSLTSEVEAPDDAFDALAVAKAGESLADAIAWARSLGDEDQTFRALGVIAYEAARSDPITSLTLALELPRSAGADLLLAHAVSQWAAVDAASAMKWAQETGTPELSQLLLSRVAVSMAEQDARTAAGLVATMLNPGEDQDCVAVSVAQRWAENDPEQCAAWINLFPDSPVQQQAAEELASIWGQSDLGAVSHWIENLPDGPMRRLSARVLQSIQPASNPEE
jgi:hypothetical protein